MPRTSELSSFGDLCKPETDLKIITTPKIEAKCIAVIAEAKLVPAEAMKGETK